MIQDIERKTFSLLQNKSDDALNWCSKDFETEKWSLFLIATSAAEFLIDIKKLFCKGRNSFSCNSVGRVLFKKVGFV